MSPMVWTLVSDTLNPNGFITFRIRALTSNEDNGVEQLRFFVVTNTGRIDERVISVEITELDNDRRFAISTPPTP